MCVSFGYCICSALVRVVLGERTLSEDGNGNLDARRANFQSVS